MILHTAPQGSEDWHRARAGVITASMFKTAREKLKTGPDKGMPSKAARDYAFRLAIEGLSGLPLDEGFTTWAMQRGIELEPEARAAHERHAGVIVQTAGFVTTDCRRFGASADGLIDDDGGAEYKCLVSPERLRETLLGNNIDEFLDQVQGGMWITGRQWWDFCIYCPALDSIGRSLTRWRVQRDDDYIASMAADLEAFSVLVTQYQNALVEGAITTA